jgi:hypothetical protein
MKKYNHKNMTVKIFFSKVILATLSLITIHKSAMCQEDGLYGCGYWLINLSWNQLHRLFEIFNTNLYLSILLNYVTYNVTVSVSMQQKIYYIIFLLSLSLTT